MDCTSDTPLFDFSKARGASDAPDVAGVGPVAAARAKPMSVSLLVRRIKDSLSDAFPDTVAVVGQVSNFKRTEAGHVYFRLKDASAAIDAVMFKTHASRLKFDLSDGLEVVASGRVDVYDTQGRLQLYVERITPRGQGELELAFRQMCEKLRAEGFFDPSAKKPIARFPRGIGIVTSATGAVLRDIHRTLARRWPSAEIYLLATAVQGKGAAEQIARAVNLLDANARKYDIDTIIVARGGGSLEDLWAFNEEVLARAIFAARTPIISGVGHETDVTVADLAADLRAATPTAAAELAAVDADEIRKHVTNLAARLRRTLVDRVKSARAAVEGFLRSAIFRDPSGAVRTHVQRMDELSYRLRAGLSGAVAGGRNRLEPLAGALAARTPAHLLQLARQRVDSAQRQLEAMSYRSVLARGYSVTRDAAGEILRSAKNVKSGQTIQTELADGKIKSIVKKDEQHDQRKD